MNYTEITVEPQYLLVDLYEGKNRQIGELEAKEWKRDTRKVRKSKTSREAWHGEEHYLIKL